MRSIALPLAGAVALCVAALGPYAVDAQAADKIPQIGFLSGTDGPSAYSRSFLQGLRERGYVEGRNVVVEFRFAAGKNQRLPDLASDLVRAGVDVIVTGSTPATVAAMQATLRFRSSSGLPRIRSRKESSPAWRIRAAT
jgi:ABC-type uncharacterized transport system substrate-binding protein